MGLRDALVGETDSAVDVLPIHDARVAEEVLSKLCTVRRVVLQHPDVGLILRYLLACSLDLRLGEIDPIGVVCQQLVDRRAAHAVVQRRFPLFLLPFRHAVSGSISAYAILVGSHRVLTQVEQHIVRMAVLGIGSTLLRCGMQIQLFNELCRAHQPAFRILQQIIQRLGIFRQVRDRILVAGQGLDKGLLLNPFCRGGQLVVGKILQQHLVYQAGHLRGQPLLFLLGGLTGRNLADGANDRRNILFSRGHGCRKTCLAQLTHQRICEGFSGMVLLRLQFSQIFRTAQDLQVLIQHVMVFVEACIQVAREPVDRLLFMFLYTKHRIMRGRIVGGKGPAHQLRVDGRLDEDAAVH